MVNLVKVQKQADALTQEERNGLLAYLLEDLPSDLPVIDDEELDRRDAEMDSGSVKPLSHEEFLRQVGR